MATVTTSDRELVRAFRGLFDLTHAQLAATTGISIATWERVERGETDRSRASRGVRAVLDGIDEVMRSLDRVPYGDLRRWLTHSSGRSLSPKDLVHRPGGLTQLVQRLRAQGDGLG